MLETLRAVLVELAHAPNAKVIVGILLGFSILYLVALIWGFVVATRHAKKNKTNLPFVP